jgi:hypothetical protein
MQTISATFASSAKREGSCKILMMLLIRLMSDN